MASIKSNSKILLLLALFMCAVYCNYSSAVFATEQNILVEVSRNCSSIKQTLSQLQRVDSRTRTYLGTSYEMISNRFLNPLNLRLSRNNIDNTEIFRVQSEFVSAQFHFREAYTDYMRHLESLIAIDCRVHPDDFYSQLEVTRDKRTTLRESTTVLVDLIQEQYAAVDKLRESL